MYCQCEKCKQTFFLKNKYLKKWGRGRFCSRKCSDDFRYTGKYKVCSQCSKKFYVQKSLLNIKKGPKYCSQKCFGISKVTSVLRECENCKKEILVTPSEIKNGRRRFCSFRCRTLFQWQNIEFRKKRLEAILAGTFKRPTTLEQQMIGLIDKYHLPYKYVGDGSFLIGYKNPDFIHLNEKKLIEVGSVYFKEKDYGSIENYEKERSEHFARYGWESYIFIGDQLNKKKILKILRSGAIGNTSDFDPEDSRIIS